MGIYDIKYPILDIKIAMNPNESVVPLIRNAIKTVDKTLSICGNFEHPLHSMETRETIINYQIDLRALAVQLYTNVIEFEEKPLFGPMTGNAYFLTLVDSLHMLGRQLAQLHMLSLWAIQFPAADPNFNYIILANLRNSIDTWIENTPNLAAVQPLLNANQTQINQFIDGFNPMAFPNGN